MNAPRIMFVCDDCIENNPDACGRFDADDIRQSPSGQWLCEYCYDEYEHEEPEAAPEWESLPIAFIAVRKGDAA